MLLCVHFQYSLVRHCLALSADSNLVGLHRQVLWLNSTQKEKKIQENEDYWHFMWNDDRSYGYFKVNVSEQVPFVLWTHLVMQYLCT